MGSAQDLKYGRVETEHKEFHDDEPVFLIRAQDPLALEAVDAYGEICSKAGANNDHLMAVAKAATAIEEWQESNPEKVKSLPDS